MKRGPGEGTEGPNKRARGDKLEVRLLIPSKAAGSIIGKGGANIQKLRTDNNAAVRIPDCPGPERVMSVEGDDADTLLAVIEQSLPLMTEEAVSNRRHSTSNSNNSQLEVRLLIHQSIVGGVIGKGGTQIKEIREKSGANIKVYQTAAPQSTDRCVTVYGTVEKISLAVREVFKIVFNTEVRGMDQPYDPINFDGFYANEYGGFGSEMDMRGGYFPPMRDGPGGGRGGMRGGMGGNFGGGPRGGSGGGGGGGMAGGFRGGFRGGFSGGRNQGFGDRSEGFGSAAADFPGINDEGEKQTTQVTIPKDAAGAIIGPGGNRIRRIRTDSRCGISISEVEADSNDRIITITGTANQIQFAQFLLQQAVREHGGPSSQTTGFGNGKF